VVRSSLKRRRGASLSNPHARTVRAGLAAAFVLAVSCAAASAAAAKTLYVSPTGNDSHACTLAAPCKTIGHAVAKARKGDAVNVAHGTYAEQVTLTKDITVVGVAGPVVNAAGQANGFLIKGPGAAGAVVRGFVVKGATFEGILAMSTSRVTISSNVVRNNNQGGNATTKTGECAPAGQVPGDCGEGLHLMSVTNSHVVGNTVDGNAGGILLTDELGPTARNVISRNSVVNNLFDCGITVAGHSTKAVSSTGTPQPKVAGIYNNTISQNVTNGNGIKGEGAGILLAAGGPGSGVYNNVVSNNTANGNGLAGVTLHSHAPGQDLNGNKIINNKLGNDGLDSASEAEFGENGLTVGILVGSGATMLKGTVITGNTITNVHYGIYTKNVPTMKLKSNKFSKVTIALTQI
jgi:nitrous oxidase accessory protein NosD